MVEIVGDYAKADPPLHAGIASIDTPSQAVPPLQHADAALAAGAPFLSLLEPALLLLALPLGTFGGAIGNADPLDASRLAAASFLLE